VSTQAGAPAQDLAAEVVELGISGLFDPAWYREVNPDVALAALDPVAHFVGYGWQEGRRPNPYFDPTWYLATYPDVVGLGMNPLLHYLRHGDLEGRRPIGHFDPDWYRVAYGLAPDRPALRHFLPRRRSGRFAPCAELYAVPCLPPWHECPGRNEDPFLAYLDHMERTQEDSLPDLALLGASGLVDPTYYDLVNGSDVRETGLGPVPHFCCHGWREKRNPNIYFDTSWYLATNPRVVQLGLNPLVHYLCEGEAASRRPVPYFDPEWYRATYGIPPEQGALEHYLAHRRSQAFSPTPLFDVAWYVARHAEEMGPYRDPFLHFLEASTRGDVDPSPRFDAAEYRRQDLRSASPGFRNLVHTEIDNPLLHYLRAEYR
jgi:hypothetical protein